MIDMTHRMIKSNVGGIFYQGGSTFVEILISLLILSLGSLGAAGLQVTSKQATYDAQQMLTATFLTNGIIERMRNNPSALATYAGDNVGGNSITEEPSPNCTEANPCNVTQLALHDRWVWEQSIDGAAVKSGSTNAGGLVKPTGCVINDNGRVQVIISWHGLDAVSDAGAVSGGVSDCGSSGANRRQVVVNTFIN